MATLTITNVPNRLVRRLKLQAARHGRSLRLEVIARLEGVMRAVPADAKALLARARRVRRAPMRLRLNDRTLAILKTRGRP